MLSSTRSSKAAALVAAALVAMVALAPIAADAHFTLNSPGPSRESLQYPGSNERFFPYAGGNTLRSIPDCLSMRANPNPPTVTAGTAQVVGFEIGNGAHHVGPCTAELIDPATGASTPLGSEANCVSLRQAMTVQLPPTTTCVDCVIKVSVKATHLSEANPEFYSSCLDVKVTGGAGAAPAAPSRNVLDTPAPVPENPVPAPSAPVPENPAPTPPAPVPAVPTPDVPAPADAASTTTAPLPASVRGGRKNPVGKWRNRHARRRTTRNGGEN
ncbi:hypothetical protein H9P43_003272 [Blastocladiella emersonii ATCC 22665]|nr:hypothetical protein H9P43_003272 [Blastocladiella emersonii ATCC 22665]